MIGVIFATKKEAFPFLNYVRGKVVDNGPFLVLKSSEDSRILPCVIIISGIGKVAAAAATVELILKYDLEIIINAGICGAINDDLPSAIGSVYRISSAIEGDRSMGYKDYIKAFKCFPFFTNLKEATLITSDKSVFDNDLRNSLSDFGDLVDMEGAAVVRISNMYHIKCDIIKGISDLADTGGIKVMESNIKKVSSTLAKTLLNAILK